jgi:hypothetical protein
MLEYDSVFGGERSPLVIDSPWSVPSYTPHTR